MVVERSENVEAVEAVEKQREDEDDVTERATDGEMEGSGEQSLVKGGEANRSWSSTMSG